MIKELNGIKLRAGQVWQFKYGEYCTQYRLYKKVGSRLWWGEILSTNVLNLTKRARIELELNSNLTCWSLQKKYIPPIKPPIKTPEKIPEKTITIIKNGITVSPGQVWLYKNFTGNSFYKVKVINYNEYAHLDCLFLDCHDKSLIGNRNVFSFESGLGTYHYLGKEKCKECLGK